MAIKDLEEQLSEPTIIKMICENHQACDFYQSKEKPITKKIYETLGEGDLIITYECKYGACTFVDELHQRDPNINMDIF